MRLGSAGSLLSEPLPCRQKPLFIRVPEPAGTCFVSKSPNAREVRPERGGAGGWCDGVAFRPGALQQPPRKPSLRVPSDALRFHTGYPTTLPDSRPAAPRVRPECGMAPRGGVRGGMLPSQHAGACQANNALARSDRRRLGTAQAMSRFSAVKLASSSSHPVQ